MRRTDKRRLAKAAFIRFARRTALAIVAVAAVSPGAEPDRTPATSPHTATRPIAATRPTTRKALKQVPVRNGKQLKAALREATPGTRILCAPGRYRGGYYVRRLRATPEAPVIIEAADPTDPPVLVGGNDGLKFSSSTGIKLRSLVIRGCRDNGVHFDDGGEARLPSRHIVLEDLRIEEIGPDGNHDAIKISGTDDFVIRNCRISGWGGSGIDMVGCHRGVVDGCLFEGREGARQKNAIQIKGGSSRILVQRCAFLRAGERAVSIGGSTGTRFFRPRGVPYEAKDVVVAGNRFVGGQAHIAWVTSTNTRVHHNIFYKPEKWVVRILQETRDERFVHCRRGTFADNLVVAGAALRRVVNVGPRTAPETFAFRHNALVFDAPERRANLPGEERGSVYGVEPKLAAAGEADMQITSSAAALKGIGPRAYEPRQVEDFTDVDLPAVSAPTGAALPGADDVRRWACYGGGLLSVVAMVFVVNRAKGRRRRRR